MTFALNDSAAAKIDGSLSFLPNDVYEVVGEDGQPHKVQVLQQIDEENVSVVVDGQVEKPVTMSKDEVQDMYDAKRRSNLKQERDAEERDPFALYADVTIKTPDGDVNGTVVTAENEDGLIEVQTDAPINGKSVVQLTRQQLEEMNAPQEQESVETEEDVIPQDAKGNPDYLSVTPERAYTHIYTQSGLKPEHADKFVDANIAVAQKELDKAKNKKEPDAITGLREYQAQLAEWESARGAAQAKLDFWNNVKAQRQAASDAARAEQLEKDKQLHDEAVKDEEQRIEEEQQQASAEAREQRKQSVANTEGDSSEDVSNSNESNEGDELIDIKETLRTKVNGWLTDENIEWAEGKDLEDIAKNFGNIPEPIAVMPPIVRNNIPTVGDNYLYCGKAYMIDHQANHHPELDISEYDNIQTILDNYDDIKDISDGGNIKMAFVKKLDKGYAVVAELSKENDKIVLHKTFFYKDATGRRVPYKNKPSILKEWSVDGSTTISPANDKQPADTENISALEHSFADKDKTSSANKQGNEEKSYDFTNETEDDGGSLRKA